MPDLPENATVEQLDQYLDSLRRETIEMTYTAYTSNPTYYSSEGIYCSPVEIKTQTTSFYEHYKKSLKMEYEYKHKDHTKDKEPTPQPELIPATCPSLEELQKEYHKLMSYGYPSQKAAMTLMDKYEKFQTEISNLCRQREEEIVSQILFKPGQYVYINEGRYFRIKKIELDFFEIYAKIELEDIKDKKSYDKTKWIIAQKDIKLRNKKEPGWRIISKQAPLYLYQNSEEFKKLKVLEDEGIIKSFNSSNPRTSIFY